MVNSVNSRNIVIVCGKLKILAAISTCEVWVLHLKFSRGPDYSGNTVPCSLQLNDVGLESVL